VRRKKAREAFGVVFSCFSGLRFFPIILSNSTFGYVKLGACGSSWTARGSLVCLSAPGVLFT
jgi:hypothetical protein